MTSPFLDNIERYPINITEGDGPYLWDENGLRYMDFWGDEATQGLGYGSNVRVLVQRALDPGTPHQLPDIYRNRTRTRLAERLLEVYGFDKVFFNNSGAEAIETAIKTARKFWWNKGQLQKKVIVTVAGNFHGRTLGALGASDSYGSGSPYHKEGFAPTFDMEGHGWPGHQVVRLELPLIDQINPRTTAALIMAPILGNNCVKVYGAGVLRQVREWCTRNNVLLIFDEIQTGSGWTGSPSAAMHYGVQPDIMTLGKRIALGFPMSATLFGPGIGEAIGLGQHFNTFAGSPFVCALAWYWLDWLQDGGYQTIKENGELLESELLMIPQVASVQREGMMLSFTPKYDGYDAPALCKAALDSGLLIVSHRPLGEIRFTPPCNITKGQIRDGIELLKSAFARVHSVTV